MGKINDLLLAYLRNPSLDTYLPVFRVMQAVGHKVFHEYPIVVSWTHYIFPVKGVSVCKRSLRFYFPSGKSFTDRYSSDTSMEDLLQDGYLDIHRKLQSYRAEGGSFWRWAIFVFRRSFMTHALRVIRNSYRLVHKSKGWLDPEEFGLEEEVDSDNWVIRGVHKLGYNPLTYKNAVLFLDPGFEELEHFEGLRPLWEVVSDLYCRYPRNMDMFFRYYGLCGHLEEALQEIGDFYGVSRQRVQQLVTRMLGKIKERVGKDVL